MHQQNHASERKSSKRAKTADSKSHAESPEFLPTLGLFIFNKKSVATT